MSDEQSNSQESGESVSYITRGARMYCNCGSHARRLNLLRDHGWVINHDGDDYNHPIANENDYKVNVNVNSFGVCIRGNIQSNDDIVLYLEGEEGEDGKTVNGPRCAPLFDDKWQDTKEDVILDLESDKSGNAKLLTTKSCLVCRYGGTIQFMSSGLEYEGELDK